MSIPEEDLPGHYLVVHNNAAVRLEAALESPVVAQLAAGEVVHVLEVLPMPEVNRVRGKLEHPSGWISLMEMKEGYRWAVRQAQSPSDPWALEKAQLAAEIQSRDAELKRWTMLAERLRAEYRQSLERASDWADLLEERILQGCRLPPSAGVVPRAFAASARAQELQGLASRLGIVSSKPQPEKEEVEPKYQVPSHLPPGSKVVGFRRMTTPELGQEEPEAVQGHGRVLHSNAILQPSTVSCVEQGGVYPLTRPPVSMATNNLLDRPLTSPGAEEKWSYENSFVQGCSFPAPASSAPSRKEEPEALQAAARALVSVLDPF